jgi:HK97 family phage prohead protease
VIHLDHGLFALSEAAMQYKAAPQFTKEISDRTVVGIFAVHGNIDDGGDMSHPGAFADWAVNGRKRARFLWMHRADDPPIAVVDYVRELGRADLPKSVLDHAPEATGAVEVSRTYLDTPRGNEVLAGIKAGAIEEMSYGYDVKEYSFEETDSQVIRHLKKVELYDISDVNWGMNPATVGAKGLPLQIEHDTALAAVSGYITRLQDLHSLRAKEGRVLSGENRKRIESALGTLDGAMAALRDLLTATDPQKARRADVARAFAEYQALQASLATAGVI